MRKFTIGLVLAAMLFGTTSAFAQDFIKELEQWVVEPCMEVKTALELSDLKKKDLEAGIKRTNIAKILTMSRAKNTKKLAETVRNSKAGSSWKSRSILYPTLLRLCLSQLRGMKK